MWSFMWKINWILNDCESFLTKRSKIFQLLNFFIRSKVKGIPTSYNKDLQEDKEALFDSFDTINYLLRIATGVCDTLTINKVKMEAALSVDLLAT
jgi:argininosuccinate lyase